MPIMWKCPGNPRCKKTYLYVSGMKAHIPSCRYAQKKAVRQKKEELETMLSIIQFVEDQQKGNVTLARKHALSFRWETPIFTRVRLHCYIYTIKLDQIQTFSMFFLTHRLHAIIINLLRPMAPTNVLGPMWLVHVPTLECRIC